MKIGSGKERKNALSVSREEDFSKWYLAAIDGADLAENSSVRGCMVIKPYGYAIWENIQGILDAKIKELGHVNCYFPMFIPIDLFAKEADQVAGFAKEMAIVTHRKLEVQDGKLTPSAPLEIPLAVRPTSELIVGESFSNWIKSYRDLPVLINQWCNVVRWEMRTRMFLRTTEFLWQEGHTAHETSEEALSEAKLMHDVYHWFVRDILKMFCVVGEKPTHEKFPGAEKTFTIELMMQDGKALQGATSHYLGETFAKAMNIQFQGRDGDFHYAKTTSWGITTRIVGAIIMSHGDDDGINLPSYIAPYHVVIVPIVKDPCDFDAIFAYCEKIKNSCPKNVRIYVDKKETSAQNKKWDYVRKGVPFICEIGKRDMENNSIFYIKRAENLQKESVDFDVFVSSIERMLEHHDEILQQKNIDICEQKIRKDVRNIDDIVDIFNKQENSFVFGKICDDIDFEDGSHPAVKTLNDLNVSIRCLPSGQSGSIGRCVLTGKEASIDVVFAKSY